MLMPNEILDQIKKNRCVSSREIRTDYNVHALDTYNMR